jgi:ankyrin repeat protein
MIFRSPLYLAAQYGSVKLVEKLMATAAVNIDQADHDGWTPLFVAAYNGHFGLYL